MKSEELKLKIDNQIKKLKEMIQSECSYKEVEKESRVLNELLKEYLEENN